MKTYYVYFLINKNNTMIYIGVTNDLIKRIIEHKEEKGSKFTLKYNVNKLAYFETFTNIQDAISREKQLKNWHRDWKWNHVINNNPDLRDLFYDLSLHDRDSETSSE